MMKCHDAPGRPTHVCMYIRARTHTGTAVKVPCWELTQPQLKKAHTHVHMHVFLALVHVHADCWTYDSLCVHISVYVCVCGTCRFNWIFFPSFYCCVLCCKSAVLSKNVLNDFAQIEMCSDSASFFLPQYKHEKRKKKQAQLFCSLYKGNKWCMAWLSYLYSKMD